MKRKLFLLLCALLTMIGVQAQDAGTYYIQNVSTGKWLGPGNSWGTQASVLNHGEYWKLAKISDGIYTLESVVSNGGTNYYLTGEWCDGGATNFTFAAVAGKENTYTIANGNYLTTNGTTVNVSGTDATATVSQWKLVSEAEMAATLDAANVENPADATFLITDHTFGRNNRYVGSWTNEGSCALTGGNSNKHCAEKYHGVYNVYQTLANAPVGCYRLTAQGFYRQDGSDNDHLPVLYANTTTATFPLKTGSENSMADACASFEQGKYAIDPIYVYVGTKGELTVGTKLETNTALWCIWDNFELTYYGDHTVAEVVLADYVKAYNAAMSEATSFTEESMWADAWEALQNAISANTLDLSDVTQAQLETATANLEAANAAATVAVANKTTYDAAVALINSGTNVDLTSIVSNASFEDGNLNGWTSVSGGNVASNNNWPGKVGTYFVERWTANGDTQSHLSDGTLTHDVLVLPAGLYTITANAQNQEQKNGVAGTGYFLCANDEKVEISASNTYSTTVLLEEDKSELVIKFALDGCTGNWISCDNVQLTYVGEDFPEYTLVTGKMNADVAAAQTAAAETFQASKTVANYNALTAAIAAAQASKDAYVTGKNALDKVQDILDNTNLYTEDAYNTFNSAYTAASEKYADDSWTNDEATSYNSSVFGTGWHSTATVDDFLISAWDVEARNWNSYHVNTWSTEGDSDGSNFKVPFIEYWTGDGSSLGEKTLIATVEGLTSGTYKVSAWVRVRAKNSVAATEATGITLDVNGANAVDVTEGTQVGTSQFQLAEYEATGYVLDDGVLTVNFNIANDNNISWLSYQKVSYTRTGDIPAADDDDYDALNDAIDAVSGNVAGFEAGEYAPYNNVEAFAALAAAQAIDQTATNAKPTVQAATAALNDVTWTVNAKEVNAIYDGTFSNAPVADATAGVNGWSAAVGLRQLVESNVEGSIVTKGMYVWGSNEVTYGETTGYTMPLKANQMYKLTFDRASWSGGSSSHTNITITDPSGDALGTATEDGYAGDWNTTDGTLLSRSVYFVTGSAGDYTLKLSPWGNSVYTNMTLYQTDEPLTFDASNLPSYIPGTYPSVSIDRPITANTWSTLIVPVTMGIPAGWSVKEMSDYDANDGKLSFTDATSIEAGKPYMVKTTDAVASIETSEVEVAALTAGNITSNGLTMKGVYASGVVPVSEENAIRYVVSGSKLHKVTSVVNIKPFRAYFELVAPSSEARDFIILDFDGETAINAIDAAETETEGLKDGKYFIEGKIVIVNNGVKYSANGQILK